MVATLSVSLVGRRPVDVRGGDPFSKLTINFIVQGMLLSASSSTVVTAAWHFDRHEADPNEVTSASHPLYHVQYGGRKMQSLQLGATLLCDPPRFLYPPMDAILAVDFVTSNFSYGAWLRLREDPSYVRLVTESYREFWEPWFAGMNAFWTENAHVLWSQHKHLCPSLPNPPLPASVGMRLRNEPSVFRRGQGKRRK